MPLTKEDLIKLATPLSIVMLAASTLFSSSMLVGAVDSFTGEYEDGSGFIRLEGLQKVKLEGGIYTY